MRSLILSRCRDLNSQDECTMRKFRSFIHNESKTVLNLLDAIYLRLRKVVVERVTWVKFRSSDGMTVLESSEPTKPTKCFSDCVH